MVEIKPFRATILNPELQVEKLVCPVYDTIDAVQYQRFAREKNNIIHATSRRKDMDRDEFIDHAKKNLDRMAVSGILVEREMPALYIYGIMYALTPEILTQLPEKSRRKQYFAFGIVCLVKVEELGKGNIVGHEKIFEINTKERYMLMKAAMMNFSPIAAEYSMPDHALNNLFEEYLGFKRPNFMPDSRKPPLVDVTLNGSRHLLWEVTDNGLIDKIMKMVSGLKILILDGHHRYTASNMMREKDGIEYTMMMLMEGGDRALQLLPWHRAVRNFSAENLEKKLKERFSIDWEGAGSEEFYFNLRERRSEFDVKLGMYFRKKYQIIRADENDVRELSERLGEIIGLDLIVLHNWLINPVIRGKPEDDVSFNASPNEAVVRVDSGEFDIAFLLNPFSIEDVEKKAFVERKNFPQKSTLFLPKVAEGIVMRRLLLFLDYHPHDHEYHQ
jgi:uncharacterized protein (DUF1015 family)